MMDGQHKQLKYENNKNEQKSMFFFQKDVGSFVCCCFLFFFILADNMNVALFTTHVTGFHTTSPCFLLLEPCVRFSRSFSLKGKGEKSKKRGSVGGGEVVVRECGGCRARQRGRLRGGVEKEVAEIWRKVWETEKIERMGRGLDEWEGGRETWEALQERWREEGERWREEGRDG